MFRIILCLALLQLASVSVFAGSPSGLKTSPILRKKTSVSKALDIRGGASLGPITPDIAFMANVVGTVLYSAELGLTSSAACNKYFGETNAIAEQSLGYFGLMLFLYTSIMLYLNKSVGVSSQILCKCSAGVWAAYLLQCAYDFKYRIFKTKQPMFIQAVMTALLAYCGFME